MYHSAHHRQDILSYYLLSSQVISFKKKKVFCDFKR
jgi:hypothetical protein